MQGYSVRGQRLALALLVLGALAALLIAPQARAISSGQAASLVLGHPTFTVDGSATAGRLSAPESVAVDLASGTVFVADTKNHRVLRFASAAALTNGGAADGVLGQPDLTSHTSAVTAQGMDTPSKLAVDAGGRLWVADYGNNRVLRFDNAASKPNGAPADGVLGQPNFTSKATARSAQGFYGPTAVAVDSAGRLWVADETNSRVLRFDGAASKANGAPADGVLGQPNFTSYGVGYGLERMYSPFGVAVDSGGRLWVADTSNHRVLRFDSAAGKPNGAPADGVLGADEFGPPNAQKLFYPRGVALDADGRLWVADYYNSRVLRFDAAASKPDFASADGVLGQPNFTSNAAATTAQGLNYPRGVAVDAAGRLWVADTNNNRVLRFDAAAGRPDGAPADGVLGNTGFTSLWPVSANTLSAPRGIAIDPASGKVFVADSRNHRVLRFASRANLSNGAAAEGVLGQPDFTSNLPATTRQGMREPWGLALDSAGRLWVADYNNDRVLRFDAAASKSNGAPADAVLGQSDFTSKSSSITSAKSMFGPTGVVVDSAGRLWVADYYNNRVLRFDAAASKANGAPANAVLGQPDFSSSNAPITASGMWLPRSLAVDAGGRLWVADLSNSRVLRFDNAAGKPNGAPANGVLGQPNFTTKTYGLSAQKMGFPGGVALDSAGRLWTAESYNNRILWFNAAASKANGAPADGVLGQSSFTTRTGATTAQGFNRPGVVVIDASGRLWMTDEDNNRVLVFEDTAP